MRRVLLISLVLVAAACSSDGGETTTTTTEPEATTTAVTTTMAVTTTTETAPETTTTSATTSSAGGSYVVGTPTLGPPDPLPGSEGASGSGCAPGVETLPDGIWFGYIVDRDASSVSFDLACMYFGDIAYEKGAEAGVEVANDYFISNVNSTLRTIPVEASVTFYEIDASQPDVVLTPTFAEWPIDPLMYIECPSDWCGVWLYINDGAVTEVMEQYFP